MENVTQTIKVQSDFERFNFILKLINTCNRLYDNTKTFITNCVTQQSEMGSGSELKWPAWINQPFSLTAHLPV